MARRSDLRYIVKGLGQIGVFSGGEGANALCIKHINVNTIAR